MQSFEKDFEKSHEPFSAELEASSAVACTWGVSAGTEAVQGSESLSELLSLGTSQMSWQDQAW